EPDELDKERRRAEDVDVETGEPPQRRNGRYPEERCHETDRDGADETDRGDDEGVLEPGEEEGPVVGDDRPLEGERNHATPAVDCRQSRRCEAIRRSVPASSGARERLTSRVAGAYCRQI